MIKRLAIAFFVVSLVVFIPTFSKAATTVNYQPRTNAEIVAYLYGRISQLLDIQKTLESGNTFSSLENAVSFNYVSVETHKAVEIEETTAVLRGEVNLFGDITASAWFEYGEDDYFLDQKTGKKNIRGIYDRAVRVKVSRLEDEERYYFRIVTENKDGSISYGKVRSFRTDEADDE